MIPTKWHGKGAVFPKELAEAVRTLCLRDETCTRSKLVQKLKERYSNLDDANLSHNRGLSWAIIQNERGGIIITYDNLGRIRTELPQYGKKPIRIDTIRYRV